MNITVPFIGKRKRHPANMTHFFPFQKREDGQYLPPELVPSSYQRLGMGFRTTPFSSGRFMEVSDYFKY